MQVSTFDAPIAISSTPKIFAVLKNCAQQVWEPLLFKLLRVVYKRFIKVWGIEFLLIICLSFHVFLEELVKGQGRKWRDVRVQMSSYKMNKFQRLNVQYGDYS